MSWEISSAEQANTRIVYAKKVTQFQRMINLNTAPNESIVNQLNDLGKRLLEICKNTDLGILNGKLCGDSIGRPTFHSILGVSAIDYAISDQDLLRHIANFIVKER